MALGKLLSKAAGKAAAKRKRLKATEGTAKSAAGARKSKTRKVKEAEGARKDPITGGSVRAAREVDAGKSGKVTRGKKSDPAKFEPTEMLSKSAKKRIEKMVEIERKQRQGKSTKAEDAFLKAARKQDAEDLRRRNVRISQSTRGKSKKVERTDYIDPETGEIFGNPTKNQLMVAARNARARGMTGREREYRAFLEKEYGVKFYAGGVADSRYANLVTINDRRKKK